MTRLWPVWTRPVADNNSEYPLSVFRLMMINLSPAYLVLAQPLNNTLHPGLDWSITLSSEPVNTGMRLQTLKLWGMFRRMRWEDFNACNCFEKRLISSIINPSPRCGMRVMIPGPGTQASSSSADRKLSRARCAGGHVLQHSPVMRWGGGCHKWIIMVIWFTRQRHTHRDWHRGDTRMGRAGFNTR